MNGNPSTIWLVIGYLTGVALDSETINVSGVGYLVHTPQPLVSGAVYELHVSTVVRDDAIALYGFKTRQERKLFNALTRVSGVGAGSALALLGELGPERVADAVAAGDVDLLSCVKGIGPKTAKAIATFAVVPDEYASRESADAPHRDDRDLIAALIDLGIEREAAQRAVSQARLGRPEAEESSILSEALNIAKARA